MASRAHDHLAATLPMWAATAPAGNGVVPRMPAPAGFELAVELAHDVRSPLGAMISMAELLQAGACGPVTASQKYQLQLLMHAAQGIARVTTDIIDSARPNSLDGSEPIAPFDVRDVLKAVRDVVQPMVESARLTLIVRNHAPTTWLGRRTAVMRVLLNLTTNALKYTRHGVVEYGARMLSPSRLEFFVRDTGCGLVPLSVSRRMDAPDASDRWKGESSGLGLTISRRLLQSMGSSLDVESRAGEGCRFSFELVSRDRV